ncbi:MAG: hypothetical protein J0I16_22600 [Rhizobiales bacterium]|nr:hypothetical protein [Hyphomicrobiales bacterium]
MSGQRILHGICDHFAMRRSEWVLALILVGIGLAFESLPTSAVPRLEAFEGFMAARIWAWGCLSIGVLRLLALAINGTFAQTWYGQWSPHVRGSLAFVSCYIWTAISIDMYSVEMSILGLVYPGLLVLEITNVKEAWQDAGEVDRSIVDAAI